MRTTLDIDESLIKKAAQLSGIKEKSSLVSAGLKALVAQLSSKRLGSLGGTETTAGPIKRRRIL